MKIKIDRSYALWKGEHFPFPPDRHGNVLVLPEHLRVVKPSSDSGGNHTRWHIAHEDHLDMGADRGVTLCREKKNVTPWDFNQSVTVVESVWEYTGRHGCVSFCDKCVTIAGKEVGDG